jgi:transposase
MKSARIKERELIIKLHKEKRSTYEIAEILGISQTKASFWVRRYKKTGSLENMPRSGRSTPLTKHKLEEIKNQLRAKHLEVKSDKAGISTKEVLQLIEQKTEQRYSIRHIERIMHKIGLSLITPRVSHIRKDENAQAKFRVEFKKNFNRHTWVFQ